MTGCYKGLGWNADHAQAAERDSSPWQENAIRNLEEP